MNSTFVYFNIKLDYTLEGDYFSLLGPINKCIVALMEKKYLFCCLVFCCLFNPFPIHSAGQCDSLRADFIRQKQLAHICFFLELDNCLDLRTFFHLLNSESFFLSEQ